MPWEASESKGWPMWTHRSQGALGAAGGQSIKQNGLSRKQMNNGKVRNELVS